MGYGVIAYRHYAQIGCATCNHYSIEHPDSYSNCCTVDGCECNEWKCPGIDLGDGNFSGCDQSGGNCSNCNE